MPRFSYERIRERLGQWHVAILVKFCDEEGYARDLLDRGTVYMRAIGAFAKAEAGDGRADPLEGQASRIMRVNYDHAIYCMTALETDDLGAFLFSDDGRRVAKEFMGESGACCIIKDPAEFILRLEKAEAPGMGFGLVNYVDGLYDVVDAFDHVQDVPFKKPRRFSYQHEFRIATNSRCEQHAGKETIDGHEVETAEKHGFEPHVVMLGSLADIAELKPSGELSV